MRKPSRIERIASDFSEVIGLSFLLGLTIAVCGYARIRNAIEKSVDPKGYARREEEKERICGKYVSALRKAYGETPTQREERKFYEYLERQGVNIN